jgi:hypothetical protein
MNNQPGEEKSPPVTYIPRKWDLPTKKNTFALILAVFGLVALIGHHFAAEHKDDAWNQKVKELCEQDGGMKVYEKARISQALYAKLEKDGGEILVLPKSEAAPDAPFFTETESTRLYSSRWFSGISRDETKFVRREDHKTLAVFVNYHFRVLNPQDNPAPFGKCGFSQDGLTKHFIQVHMTDKR